MSIEHAEPLPWVAAAQGAYWLATGLWPIVHFGSFEAVTGPKRESWLVKTLGGLIAVVGAVLFASAVRRRLTPEVRALGFGSTVALGAADVIYAAKRRISPVYLGDALLEGILALGWRSMHPQFGLLSPKSSPTVRSAPAASNP